MIKFCEVCNKEVPANRKKHCSSKCNKQAYLLKNPTKVLLGNRISHIKQTYGLTWEDYVSLYERCNGKCTICKTPVELMGRTKKHANVARIDHCHATGKVRGLLCNECNKGLGCFKDNIESLKNAINYLEESL